MHSKFDWIAVSLTSSGSGKPFGAEDRIGARVTVGVRMEERFGRSGTLAEGRHWRNPDSHPL